MAVIIKNITKSDRSCSRVIPLWKFIVLSVTSLFLFFSNEVSSAPRGVGDNMMMGLPFGGPDESAYQDICPQGTRIVNTFLHAWSKKDYRTMYYLIDNESKRDYTFNDARFDFEFLEYKEYVISSARRQGSDYEFILSYGDWKYGDKDIKKILISGRSFKIIMPSRGELFKRSADSYF